VAVVLTLVQTKQIRINIHKRNNTKNTVQTIRNTLHTSTHITKTHTHTLHKKLKQTQCKTHSKWNRHNTIKYPQYKVTLMYMALLSPRFTVAHFTSLQNKIISHKSRHFAPHHYTSHHFTYLYSIPIWIPLLVTTFFTPFLNLFSLQGKDASKPENKLRKYQQNESHLTPSLCCCPIDLKSLTVIKKKVKDASVLWAFPRSVQHTLLSSPPLTQQVVMDYNRYLWNG
jgi:hypothetical protein